MPIHVQCPHCSAQINVRTFVAGQKVKCPKCSGSFPLPGDSTPAETAASPNIDSSAASGQANTPKGHCWKTIAAAVTSSVKATAQMARAKAEETKITTVDLSKAFFALGNDIFQRRRFEDGFADIYGEIDMLQKKIAAAKKDSAPADPDSFGEKAKALADKAQRAVTAKALSVKAQSLVRRLGKEAFERHGRDSGAAELVQVIDEHNRRADELRIEIDELQAVAKQGLRSTDR
jgi:predicted Zn finger-like uncharacterized protein